MREGEDWMAFARGWTEAARGELRMWTIPNDACGHTVAERLVAGVLADAAVDHGVIAGPSGYMCSACVVAKLREGGVLTLLVGLIERPGDPQVSNQRVVEEA